MAARDRLIFPLDGVSEAEAWHWVELLAADVGLFKIGLELFIRSGPALCRRIQGRGARVFLDLKLHDIPATVRQAMGAIAELGVTFATVHCDDNPAMLEAAVEGAGNQVQVLGVTVLTSINASHLEQGGLRQPYSEDPRQLVLLRARRAQSAGCACVVCSGNAVSLLRKHLGRAFITVTPGIRPAGGPAPSDDQQRVSTPYAAIASGADYLVVGRPIRQAPQPLEMVRRITAEIGTALRALGGTPNE